MRKIIALCCLMGILLLSACTPTETPTNTTTSSTTAGTTTSTEDTTTSTEDTTTSTEDTTTTTTTVPSEGTDDETPSDDVDATLDYKEIIPTGNTAQLLNPQKGGADKEAETLRQEILNTEDTLTITGTKYYISSNGNDDNDGTSPATAWKTTDALLMNNYLLEPGDAVLFERGGIYRRNSPIIAMEGVTYGAYGEGDKPAIYGSSTNYAWGTQWQPSRKENIWKVTIFGDDAGIVVFNHGEAVGTKKLHGINELSENGDYYHNSDTSILYMYCDKGYPNVIYKDIEIGTKENIFTIPPKTANVTIDNLAMKYAGCFGVDVQEYSEGFSMTNCELGWIGGSRFYNSDAQLGNAIQFWENTTDALVENNWIYQVYDAGITPQGTDAKEASVYKNLVLRKNLVEFCSYSIEWFDRNSASLWDGFVIEDNILRFAGYGWAGARPDTPAVGHFVGWTFLNDDLPGMSVKNNIFDCTANNMVYWNSSSGWKNHANVKISGNSFYQKANLTGNVLKYADKGQLKATNQAEFEVAMRMFDPDAKVIKWVS